MGNSKIPLAKGLIGKNANVIHGQLEVTYYDYHTVKIEIKRKAYCGLPNVKFTISDTDLPDIIDILYEADEKIEKHWLSKVLVKKTH